MNDLRVIENELVPVYVTSTGEKVVYGTELYECLGSKQEYSNWVKNRLRECDSVEDADFTTILSKSTGGRPKQEYIIKLATAKEMAMLEHNQKGKQVRRYFIRIEEKYKEAKKKVAQTEQKRPSLTAVTGAAKFLTSLTEKAGCDGKIQLLTAKSFYETNGYPVLVEIGADKQYWDTVHIARQAGIYVKSSGKPADKAVNEIIRRIEVTEDDYVDTWESKGKWQGTVRKYSDSVIERVKCWIADNDYPSDIEYQQADGQMKAWHVTYQDRDKEQTDAKAM
ncbi:antA/AntB antirepressor family protein [Enterocloster clostridioformis]|uniref:antA/AntB antirepressor family protein n=1 Tax=Enterocloster clostridioformis TaxID=1531 RepID=UPI00033CBCEF|nr:toxin-antitoxin system toxin component Bro family [Enterocloster bolteae CAG:59]